MPSWQVLITRLYKVQEKYFAFSWQKMTAGGAKSRRRVLYLSTVKISTLPVIMATINQGTAIYKKNRDSFLNTSRFRGKR